VPEASPPPVAAAPAESTLLLRFGELTLKSEGVRRRFTTILRRNIEDAFSREGLDCLIRDDWGHLYVDTSDPVRGIPLLTRTFGLTSVSPVALLRSSALEEVARFSADYALPHLPPEAGTFAVRPRRTGSHPYSSTDLGRTCGAAILQRARAQGRALAVDLSNPDFEVEVEVRENVTYLYARRVACAGGMPLGAAGKVVCVLRDEAPGAAMDARAAWMVAKRGALPLFVAGGDEATRTPGPHAAKALEHLTAWVPRPKVWVATNPADPRLLASMANRYNAHAFVIGVRARGGEVDGPTELAPGFPTFHPLLALSDAEVDQIPLAP
jgi:thiamine biosynthesis protein ThiI